MLQGLIADGVAEPPMHRLHGFPLAVVEQRVEVLTGRVALRVSAEAVREPVGKVSESLQERSNRPLRHALKSTKLSTLVQARRIGSSRTTCWI